MAHTSLTGGLLRLAARCERRGTPSLPCVLSHVQVLRSGLNPGNKSLAELQVEYRAARAQVSKSDSRHGVRSNLRTDNNFESDATGKCKQTVLAWHASMGPRTPLKKPDVLTALHTALRAQVLDRLRQQKEAAEVQRKQILLQLGRAISSSAWRA